MLGIDERGGSAVFLHLGEDVERDRGLTGGFRPKDFHNPPARNAADADGVIEGERPGVDRLHLHVPVLAQPHDGAGAEGALDLGDRRLQRFLLALLVQIGGYRRF